MIMKDPKMHEVMKLEKNWIKKKQNVVGYGFQLQTKFEAFTPQSLYWLLGGSLLVKP